MASEKTFIMIKPNGVQRGLVGEIIKRFEATGFKLVDMKLMQVGIAMLGAIFQPVAYWPSSPLFSRVALY